MGGGALKVVKGIVAERGGWGGLREGEGGGQGRGGGWGEGGTGDRLTGDAHHAGRGAGGWWGGG